MIFGIIFNLFPINNDCTNYNLLQFLSSEKSIYRVFHDSIEALENEIYFKLAKKL